MTENKRFKVIHLGNLVECLIKDFTSNTIIGVFSSMHNPVNEVCDLLNEQKERINKIERENTELKFLVAEYQRSEKEGYDLR